MLQKIITNILTAVYQYFWVSMLFAFILMTCYLFVYEKNSSVQGVMKTLRLWLSHFKRSFDFRLLFFLVFYGALISFRTLLGRGFFANPLQSVTGGWQLYIFDASGKNIVSTDGFENILLFIPFSFLLLWLLNTKQNRKSIAGSFFVSCRAVLIFSLIIEFSQMFFCLGIFQFADIVYNTSGGIIGGLIYLMCYGIVRAIKKNRH